MNFDRNWTSFALDAEVEAFGTSRIASVHNKLRAEVAALQDQRREMHADISDLAVLVRRLALALRKAQPEHSTVSDAAMEFLRKRGLDGEVLR